MANVWEAMKRRQAEVAAKVEAEDELIGLREPDDEPDDGALIDIELMAKPDKAPPDDTPEPMDSPPRSDQPLPSPAPSAEPGVTCGDMTFSGSIVAHHDRGGGIAEEYRALRTSLLARSTNGKFSYIITSAETDEGKTVTCLNLAVVLAERAERSTIIIDGDLRKGTIARMLGVPRGPGMTDLLRGQTTLKEVIHPTVYPNLFFLPSGKAETDEIGGLLSRMERDEIFNDICRLYDYVIVDTPPINIAADAGVLGQSVGEALMVVRMNKTRQESVEKAIRLLHAANVDLSGLVLTHRKYYIPNYLYRYS